MDKRKYTTALDNAYKRKRQRVKFSRESIEEFVDAVKNGDADTVERYVVDGIDVNVEDAEEIPVLILAAEENHKEIVKILLDAGADTEAEGGSWQPALVLAAEKGHEEIVKMLLDAGADINVLNGDKNMALNAAIKGGHEKIVEVMLDRGVHIEARNSRGETALIVALRYNRKKIVEMLIDAGANIHAADTNRETALIIAVNTGSEEIMNMLVDRGAHIEARNLWGETALHSAAARGYTKIVKLLLARGANIEAEDHNGETALTHADKSNFNTRGIIRILLIYGAECPRDGDLSPIMKPASFFQKQCRELIKDIIEKARMFYPVLKNELATRTMLTEYVLIWMKDEDRRYTQKSESAAEALACYALASALKKKELECPRNYNLPGVEPYEKPYDVNDPRCRRELYMQAWSAYKSWWS